MTPDYLAAQKRARPLVQRILRWSDDVDDVLQDATVKAIVHSGQFRGSCKFETWYCRIAITTALMRLRKVRELYEVPEDVPSPGPEPDSAAIAIERKERLLAAASKLSPVLREEFWHYLREETAHSPRTKGNRFRIRNKLRVALAGVV